MSIHQTNRLSPLLVVATVATALAACGGEPAPAGGSDIRVSPQSSSPEASSGGPAEPSAPVPPLEPTDLEPLSAPPALPPPEETNLAVDAALRVDEFALETYPDTYASYFLTDFGNKLIVYLTQPDSAVEQAISAVANLSASDLTFDIRPNTAIEQQALADRLNEEGPQLVQEEGMPLAGWGLNFRTGLVEIQVFGLTDEIRDQLMQMYGPYVVVSNVTLDQLPQAVPGIGKAGDEPATALRLP